MIKLLGKTKNFAASFLAIALCVMLVAVMLPSDISIIRAANSTLINLDMSTYVKDTRSAAPSTISGSIGSIADSGSLNSSTLTRMYSRSGHSAGLDISKESFNNAAGGKTYYLHRTIKYNPSLKVYTRKTSGLSPLQKVATLLK